MYRLKEKNLCNHKSVIRLNFGNDCLKIFDFGDNSGKAKFLSENSQVEVETVISYPEDDLIEDN